MADKDVLRGILEREEITILFQPIFDLQTGEPHGFEALARGPKQTAFEGYASLYDVANTADLLPELDRVCRRRAILAARHLSADYNLFVKMFPMFAGDDSLCGKELISLLEGALTPTQLVWEISERQPVKHVKCFRDSVRGLTELGCRFALDNFGSGYSGLAEIFLIEPQYIKVARVFTRDIHTSSVNQKFLSAFRSLARGIEANFVVTGIEQMEELKTIRSIGVNLAQGNLLARPSETFQTVPSVPILG